MWTPGQVAAQPAPVTLTARPPAVDVWGLQPALGASTQIKDRLLAALAYVTVIPAVALLLVPAFRRSRFVRFHAIQSILFAIDTILLAIVVRILFSILAAIPRIGFLMAWLTLAIAALGLMMVWLVLLIKALQGQIFRLPLIGHFADKAEPA